MEKSLTTSIKETFDEHGSEILVGVGIAGFFTSGILAIRATTKAVKLLERREEEKGEKLTKKEVIKNVWLYYLPSLIISGLSTACVIGGYNINYRRGAALAAAYTLSESTLKKYQEKIVEKIGEREERKVRDEIAEDKIKKNPVSEHTVILTEKGNTLCYDSLSGRYFKSDIEKIKQSINEINKRMIDEMSISLNDFYSELGLDPIGVGYNLGWDVNRNGFLDISFTSHLTAEDVPCLMLNYQTYPLFEY